MKEKINWQGPEHFHTPKESNWYWAVGIVSVAIAISAVLLENYIFAIFIILAVFTLMIFVSKDPRIVDFEINNKGVLFEKDFFPYEFLEAFDIDEKAFPPRIILKAKKILMPYIILPLGGEDSEEVIQFLGQFLKKDKLQEPLLQKFLEFLGF